MPINAGPNRPMGGMRPSSPMGARPRPMGARPMPSPMAPPPMGINAGPSTNMVPPPALIPPPQMPTPQMAPPPITGPMNPSRGIPFEQGGFIGPRGPLPQMGGMGPMPIDTAPANIPNMGQGGMGQGPIMGGGLRNAYQGGGPALQKRPFGLG